MAVSYMVIYIYEDHTTPIHSGIFKKEKQKLLFTQNCYVYICNGFVTNSQVLEIPQWSSSDDRINKLWCSHTMESYFRVEGKDRVQAHGGFFHELH